MLLGILNSQVDAGGGSAYELISTQVLASSASSVTFSSIPSDYKHLQIRAVAKSASSNDNLIMRFNADTGNNYNLHYLYGNGSSVASAYGTAPYVYVGQTISSGLANQFATAVCDILDFGSTSKNTTIRSLAGNQNSLIQLISGLWRNTAAVTSITLAGESYQLASGSRFSLYGVKG